MTDDDHPKLADLHIDTIRRENDHVDTRLAELESEISELESDKEDLKDEVAEVEADKEAAEKLLADFHEGQRKKQLNRIQEANEAVSEDTEVDLSTLEDASADQLETVADMLEAASGATVDNSDNKPDVAGTAPDTGADDLESRKAELAQEGGLAGMYKSVKEGNVTVDHDAMGADTGQATGADIIDSAMGGEQ